MELAQPPQGRGVTEFNDLYQTAYRGCVECVVASSAGWGRSTATTRRWWTCWTR